MDDLSLRVYLETGAAVMDPADPTNMAVTAAESGRAL